MSGKGQARSGWKLALIILIYSALATAYSVVTPIGRGADEWAHYWYAQFIAEHGRLPLNPVERETAGYKSDWPPLYHLGAAAITAWVDTAGPPTFKYRADPAHIRRQIIPAPSSEAILHTEDELFPWRQEILVWRLGRFLSIIYSAGTLWVTYRLALEVFAGSRVASSRGAGEQGAGENASRITHHTSRITPSPQTLALVCVVFLAFIPRFLFTGMLFNYDSLTLLVASLFFWLGVRIAKGYYPGWGFWGLGALAGLALLTKYLTALLPLEILFLAFSRGVGEQGSRGEIEASPLPPRSPAPPLKLGQAALAFILVTAPWFSYLLVNFNEIETYGPVLGTIAPLLRGDGSDRTVEQIFALMSGGQAPVPAHIEQQHYPAEQLISEFFTTLWTNPITRPLPLNWFVVVITGMVVVALLGLVKWPRRLCLLRSVHETEHATDAMRESSPHPNPLPKGEGILDLLPSPFGRGDGGEGYLRRRSISRSSSPFHPSDDFPTASPPRLLRVTSLLLLHCLLSLPFMAVRLFGARDALEAVQGRHVLFLAGPALAILVVWGGLRVMCQMSSIMAQSQRAFIGISRITHHASRITVYGLIGLLLIGSVLQLISLWTGYPPLLPVRTLAQAAASDTITLPGGAILMDASVTPVQRGRMFSFVSHAPPALQAKILWQGGAEPAPEDYQLELVLLDKQGQIRASWLGYQTQARYPTRVWEAGDTIRDEGWLPLAGLEIGDYEIRWRILGENGPVLDWQTLSTYTLTPADQQTSQSARWLLWRDGHAVQQPPLLRERETAQFTFTNLQSPISNLYLIGPDQLPHPPVSSGKTWANFIIGPTWPPGDYRWQPDGPVVLQVAASGRNFQVPPIAHPLEANFAGQIKLLGYDLPTRRIQPGEGLPVTLYWQGLRWMSEDFVIFDRLLDNQGMSWGGYDRRAKENHSTLFWTAGEVITDGFAVSVDPAAPPGIYTLSLGWYRRIGEQADSLPILNSETGEPDEATAVTIGPVKVGGPPPGVTVAAAAPQTEVGIILGEQIKLLGFDIDNCQLSIDNCQLLLTLYWQALRPPDADYTVFVHLRNATGETVAQKDGPPAGGAYPTGLWDAGEIIKDDLTIPLEQVRPGRYKIVVGLYDFVTGVRLPVTDSPDGTIVLRSFEVAK